MPYELSRLAACVAAESVMLVSLPCEAGEGQGGGNSRDYHYRIHRYLVDFFIGME